MIFVKQQFEATWKNSFLKGLQNLDSIVVNCYNNIVKITLSDHWPTRLLRSENSDFCPKLSKYQQNHWHTNDLNLVK